MIVAMKELDELDKLEEIMEQAVIDNDKAAYAIAKFDRDWIFFKLRLEVRDYFGH